MDYAKAIKFMLSGTWSETRDRHARFRDAMREANPGSSEATLRNLPSRFKSGERKFVTAAEWEAIRRHLRDRYEAYLKAHPEEQPESHLSGQSSVDDHNGSVLSLPRGTGLRGHPESTAERVSSPQHVEGYRGGVVEAGAFREDDMLNVLGGERVWIKRSEQYPWADHVSFLVRGDSMEGARIFDGDTIECIAFDGSMESLDSGKIVVVERRRDGMIERSVKQVVVFPDRIEFQPRTHNPRHQAIVIPKNEEYDEGEIRVLAIVVRSYREY